MQYEVLGILKISCNAGLDKVFGGFTISGRKNAYSKRIMRLCSEKIMLLVTNYDLLGIAAIIRKCSWAF